MDPLLLLFIVIMVIAITAVAEKVGVAAPLLLVVIGVALSFTPWVPAVEIEPEIILAGILPPLLYSWAVAMPTMDLRRDFAVVSGLAVVLVILGAFAVGLLFWALLPGMSLAAGVAFGAAVGPTDAVAVKIVKQLGAPSRVVTMLEGEGMLNDATALVLMRSAIAATAVSLTFGEVLGDFLWAVAAAAVVGYVIGMLGLFARRAIHQPALTAAVSLTVPFVAFTIAEHLGASGLVAVVVAGLLTGHRSPRYLNPRDRMFGLTIWSTIEQLLEGALFFMMGLELATLIAEVHTNDNMLVWAVWLALATAFLALMVRGLFVLPLIGLVRRTANRRAANRGRLDHLQQTLNARVQDAQPGQAIRVGGRYGRMSRFDLRSGQVHAISTRLSRRVADTDYLLANPMNSPEGILLVFAGMRGVITLAGAQTLPRTFPNRHFLILVAFLLALGSLLIQGSLLPWIVRWLHLDRPDAALAADAHQIHLDLERVAADFLDSPELVRADGQPYDRDVVARVRTHVVHATEGLGAEGPHDAVEHHAHARELWKRALEVQRDQLLVDRALGVFDSRALEEALVALDAEQMMIEMKPDAWLTEE